MFRKGFTEILSRYSAFNGKGPILLLLGPQGPHSPHVSPSKSGETFCGSVAGLRIRDTFRFFELGGWPWIPNLPRASASWIQETAT